MTPPFDILRAETSESVLWLESAMTFESAKTRVQQLAASSPGEYLIFNQNTQNKVVINIAEDEERGHER